MHIFTRFKLALTNLTTASKQAPFKLGQNLAYLALLALIGALPYFFIANQTYQILDQNGEAIATKLPEFSSQQGQLLTSDQAQPYIQKTDLLVLAYDPADQLAIDQVPSRNQVPQAKILVQSKQIQVDIMGITAGQDYSSLPFEFNSHHLASLIREATQARLSNYLLVFLSLFIFAYLRFALISFFTSLITKILLADQKMAWSVTLLAMTTPLCILSLINLFLGLLPFQDAILIAVTLFRVRQLKNLHP